MEMKPRDRRRWTAGAAFLRALRLASAAAAALAIALPLQAAPIPWKIPSY